MPIDVICLSKMFNMVFFITILSLLIQGTTVKRMAQWLGLVHPMKEPEFKMYLPDDITTSLSEMTVDAKLLSDGALLRQVSLPKDTLVIMIKHGEKVIVPRGDTRLYLGDVLLLISEHSHHE